ncbi:MAG: cytochrome c, partial [Betaproteobacteria bacterium]
MSSWVSAVWAAAALVAAAAPVLAQTGAGSAAASATPNAQAQARAEVVAQQRFGFGRPARPEEIAAWDVDVRPDGHGLKPGR